MREIVFLVNTGYKVASTRIRFYEVYKRLNFKEKRLVIFPWSLSLWRQKNKLIYTNILLGKRMVDFLKAGNRLVFDFSDRIKAPYLFSQCDMVITNNDFNLDYVRRFNSCAASLIDPVDDQRYHPFPRTFAEGKTTLGWVGSPPVSAHLIKLKTVLFKLKNKFPALEVLVVGGDKNLIPKNIPWIQVVDWDYNRELEYLARFDIGISPLAKNEQTLAKGGYKLLQYLALGLPIVADDVGVNRTFISGNGFLCHYLRDWERSLSVLIKNKELRNRMGEKSRAMSGQYSYDQYLPKLTGILSPLLFAKN